jgi:hypothetical protein
VCARKSDLYIREKRKHTNTFEYKLTSDKMKTVPGKVATNTHRGWKQRGYLNKHYNINKDT